MAENFESKEGGLLDSAKDVISTLTIPFTAATSLRVKDDISDRNPQGAITKGIGYLGLLGEAVYGLTTDVLLNNDSLGFKVIAGTQILSAVYEGARYLIGKFSDHELP